MTAGLRVRSKSKTDHRYWKKCVKQVVCTKQENKPLMYTIPHILTSNCFFSSPCHKLSVEVSFLLSVFVIINNCHTHFLGNSMLVTITMTYTYRFVFYRLQKLLITGILCVPVCMFICVLPAAWARPCQEPREGMWHCPATVPVPVPASLWAGGS